MLGNTFHLGGKTIFCGTTLSLSPVHCNGLIFGAFGGFGGFLKLPKFAGNV